MQLSSNQRTHNSIQSTRILPCYKLSSCSELTNIMILCLCYAIVSLIMYDYTLNHVRQTDDENVSGNEYKYIT